MASQQPIEMSATEKRSAYLVLVLVMLLHVVDGLDMQLLGVTVNALSSAWALPLSAFGAAMAAGHAGAAVGAALGGLLGDRLGRRKVIVGGVFLFSLGSLAMALAGTPRDLTFLRFIAGIGLGGCLPPALALLADTMPDRFRGLAISLVMLCFPLGIALAGFLAIAVIPDGGWQAMFVVGGAIALVFAFMLLFGLAGISKRSETIATGSSQSVDRRGALGRLLMGDQNGKLLPLLGVFICCYFTTNMMLSWLPGLMATSGADPETASGAISVWSLAGMGGIVLSGIIMTRWGIRRAVAIYLGGGIVALGALALATNLGADVTETYFFVLLGFGGCMLTGTISTIFAYCADIFESEMRSSAIGLSATSGRIGAIIGSGAGASILEMGGAPGVFGSAAIMFAMALLFYAIAIRGLRRSHSPA